MTPPSLSRREALQTGSAALAALLAQMSSPGFTFADQAEDEELVPFENMPRSRPGMLDWETLDSWITPQDQVFGVQHYGVPEFDAKKHALEVTGLVEKPMTLTLDDLKQRENADQLMTLECSGNGASKGFMSAIYNSKWTGTPLLSLLKDCGVKPEVKEVVFIGVDRKEETLRKGTNREVTVEVPFGRSMSLEDVEKTAPLLAWARNGEPLTKGNGAPLRLIVPGWYGIANVKWLRRIELRDTRYMGRFMARDYVTLRGERRGDEIVYVETSVNMMNLKSIVARVTRLPEKDGKVPTKAYGAAWDDGTEITKVEVKVDDGPWRQAKLAEEPRAKFSWLFFSIDLGGLAPGTHTIVSRAFDAADRVQPAAEDDEIALKKTYWEAYAQWPREVKL
jgi:DMSO/TMAO reductase YedYZ molybdopterin-dependent catalytic subunit